MSETTHGTDRSCRRAKRFLTPSQKYEIWLQLVRQEVTIAGRGRPSGWTGRRSCGSAPWPKRARWPRWRRPNPAPRPGSATTSSRPPRRRTTRFGGGAQGDGREADAGRGKRTLGLSGRVPLRVDAATKGGAAGAARLRGRGRLDAAAGLPRTGTFVRSARTAGSPAARPGSWPTRRRAGCPVHGLLDEEAAEILALFEEWGPTDRSHRKNMASDQGLNGLTAN